MNVRLLHATDPNLYSLKPLIRVFKETKGKREASEECETRTKAKRAETRSSTKEREGKNACSATQAKLTYA